MTQFVAISENQSTGEIKCNQKKTPNHFVEELLIDYCDDGCWSASHKSAQTNKITMCEAKLHRIRLVIWKWKLNSNQYATAVSLDYFCSFFYDNLFTAIRKLGLVSLVSQNLWVEANLLLCPYLVLSIRTGKAFSSCPASREKREVLPGLPGSKMHTMGTNGIIRKM